MAHPLELRPHADDGPDARHRRNPAGTRGEFIPHRHDPVEAYYVLAGEGVVFIDGVEHAVRAGSVAYLPGETLHGAFNTGSETMRLLYVFAADSFDEVEYRFAKREE